MAANMLRLRQVLEVPDNCRVSDEDLRLLGSAAHPSPRQVLGPQVIGELLVIRCWVSGAEVLSLRPCASSPGRPGFALASSAADADAEGSGGALPQPGCARMARVAGLPEGCQWLFEAVFAAEQGGAVPQGELDFELEVEYGGGASAKLSDPYSLLPLLPEEGLKAWAGGAPSEEHPPAAMFGARHMELLERRPGLWGTRFAVWAPHAKSVSVVGDFNCWDGRAHPMCKRDGFGVWELFVSVWDLRGKKYAYQVTPADGGPPVVKTDPFGSEFVDPVDGGHDAKVPHCSDFDRAAWGGCFAWSDAAWLARRAVVWAPETWAQQPLSIYEVHLGSWMAGEDGKPLGYRAVAEPLAKHALELGVVAVELLPLSQYPADESWGYQCASGLYAVDSRLGSPDDFRYLVDTLHRHGIAVFVDFVLAHFARDPWGLASYSGAPQFEYEGALGELPGWGTARFNYAKPEVRSYLCGAAEHWITHFHVDGLRLDAVAAMVYSNFGKEEDGDAILAGRGTVNPDGVSLLRELCARVRRRHPGVLLAAEESTNFKWVTERPAEPGSDRFSVKVEDLGFHLKWNMGFTFDTLAYFGKDPAARPQLEIFGCKQLAWYLAYAFNERWVLPFSHDNAHPRSLLDQMAGTGLVDAPGRFAQLRLLLAYLVGMPGRPLLFMGSELGDGPWSHKTPIQWRAVEGDPIKAHLRQWVAKLMRLYRELPALHRQDDDAEGFEWLDMDASSRCVYAWRRKAKGEADVVVVVNASSSVVAGYRLAPGPREGPWRLLASSASADSGSDGGVAIRVQPEGVGEFSLDLPGCAAQFWTCGPDPLAAPPSPSAVVFEVRHPSAGAGDQVRIVGSCAALGDWQPSSGLLLGATPASLPVWRAEVDFGPSAGELEFKCVLVKADGSAEWESIEGNRTLSIGGAGVAGRSVSVEFGKA
mmetsp:Transcript_30352/g.86848  ORF Transcript_30352/g.86848 Transcript_30352/m.86848 type:complete len:929 (-) Transcript_30352:247-3033(-)